MRVIKADLLEDVVSVYDQTKTTVQGRVAVKTVDGDSAIGPPLNKFLDAFTDGAFTPAANAVYLSPNGRLFALQTEASGVSQVILYNFNLTTGAATYVGKIQISLPDVAATSHSFRSLKVLDTGTSGWKMFVTTTGSVLINGGTFLVNSLALSDFVPIGFPTIPYATGNDQKAVYFLQDPANIGAGQLQTTSAGSVVDIANSRIYVHNGVSLTHQYYVYDTSIAPTYTSEAITGTEATNTINHVNTFVNGDPIKFDSLTGGAGLVVGTTYFVINRTGTTYQVSATSGGAAINFTTDISAGTVGRAFGTTGSNFVHKTGNLPALAGTLLLTDSEDYAVPGHTTNAGQPCAFFATSSALYLGQLSELTSGAVTWPSLVTANVLGSTNQIIGPTVISATWSNVLDRAIYVTNVAVIIIKQMINNSIETIFGGVNNRYLEGLVNPEVVEAQTALLQGLDVEDGWMVFTGTSTGQRGFYLTDIRANALYDHSYIVTKVLNLQADTLEFITSTDKLFAFTGSLKVQYRTSGFGSISGGWTDIPFAENISAFAPGSQIQFKILFDTLGLDTSIPAQLTEFYLAFNALNDISDNWEYSQDDSSSGNPTDIVFRLKEAYSSAIPTLRFLATDLTNSVVTDHNSITNVANFSYSTNSGVSWVPFGTPPNTVGTLVRYRYTTPPGVDIRPSLKEA